jgi:Zn-dependent M16 (insulinase) family peptidase
MTNAAPANAHPAFSFQRSQTIESLNITVEEYHHKITGAVHYHLASDNDENVFLVGLRTVPMDSTGVAHILEHTALCGSKRYPVRDPFFMMIRRSLNTFMNAFTSSDWTAYPFASQNRKDFNNLLDVYLDAVFFSRLDELDFRQEGHRVEFADTENPDSELVYKGVVFNEMKGAMSSVPSTLWQTLCKYLFPSTTYHYNSGGDPVEIPELSYEELRGFYETHYHPSNAFFMTYGNIPAAEHHANFEEKALKHFDALDVHIAVEPEDRLLEPVLEHETYAFSEEGDLSHKTHVVTGWLLGESTELESLLKAQLLSSVLLDNSASPLQHVLETTELGTAPSPLCGLEDSMRELVFVCGVEGSTEQDAEKFEQLVLDTLQKFADEGVPQDQVEAVLHQLELHQREVGGDGYPYGLQLILQAIGNVTHRGDPIAVLNIDPVLEKLRESIKDPEFIKGLARELLLDNPHRVTLILNPDDDLAGMRTIAEKAKLIAIKEAMSSEEKQAVIDQAKALEKRQNQQDDESILPKVTIQDVPADMHRVDGDKDSIGNIPVTRYCQGTNGLVYHQVLVDMPDLPTELTAILPYYSNCLTELGVGDKDYMATQAWQSKVCGSIDAFTTMRGDIDNEQQMRSYLVLSSKALVRNLDPMLELVQETLLNVRFDELSRIRELVSQQRARREMSVTNNGHSLAMAAASSGLSPCANLSYELSGLAGIRATKQLDKDLDDKNNLQTLAQQLQSLHQQVLAAPKQLLLISEENSMPAAKQALQKRWGQQHNPDITKPFSLPQLREQRRMLWLANTQVNFCAKAYPTVPMQHADAPALTVLAGFLRNGFLHRAIREQGGAYGGGASQDSNNAVFRFFSYRDPRVEETLDDFDKAIEWMLNTEHNDDQLEQAILGVVGSLDKPSSPAGEAKQAFHNNLFGRSYEERKAFRQKILEVTLADLNRVTGTYLNADRASCAVISSQANYDNLKDQDFIKNWQVNQL